MLIISLKSESFIMKSVTILAFFSLNYFLNWYQTIKTVNGTLKCCFQQHWFNCLQHIWCQIFVIQCEYSSKEIRRPSGARCACTTLWQNSYITSSNACVWTLNENSTSAHKFAILALSTSYLLSCLSILTAFLFYFYPHF